jgi:hypothetical protein
MTWLEDIGAYLQVNGLGTLATDIFYKNFDNTATNCIALIDQAGQRAEVSLSNDMILKKPELGVRVRNMDDTTAELKARAIYDLLNLKVNTVIGSTRFKRIVAIAEPFFVSQSKTDLFIYSINFEIQVTS